MAKSMIPENEEILPCVTQDELDQIKEAAARVKSNAHLKVIIRAAKPEMREQCYLLISRYITKFKPIPFDKKWAFD